MPSSQLSGDRRQGETLRRHGAAHKAAQGENIAVETRPHEEQVLIITCLHAQRSELARNQYISIHATFSYLSEAVYGESLCQ